MHPGFVLTLFLTASAPLAQQAGASGQESAVYTGCVARAGSSTVQQGMCAQAELTRQDARLNHAYQALLTTYTRSAAANTEDSRARTLRDEERAWIADRDQVCKLNHDTVDNVCLIQRESARADELEARLRRLP